MCPRPNPGGGPQGAPPVPLSGICSPMPSAVLGLAGPHPCPTAPTPKPSPIPIPIGAVALRVVVGATTSSSSAANADDPKSMPFGLGLRRMGEPELELVVPGALLVIEEPEAPSPVPGRAIGAMIGRVMGPGPDGPPMSPEGPPRMGTEPLLP